MTSWRAGFHRAVSTGMAVAAVCMLAPGLCAESDGRWNVGVGVAYAFAYDSDYESVSESATGYGQDRLESGFGAHLGVGYRFTRFSVEAEIVHFKNDTDQFESEDGGSAESTTGDFTHTALMFNGGIYLRPMKTWKPYAGIGLGVSRFSINDLTDLDGDFRIDGRDTVLALQATVGVAYDLSDPVDLEFGYRVFWSDEAEATGIGQGGESFINTSGPVLIHSIDFGVRF